MKTIVITGSTRGLGHGLATAFLDRACQVVISGRRQESVDAVVADLATRYPVERILGQACDVGDFAQVQALWDATIARFGTVDIWINNAALAAKEYDAWLHEPETIAAVMRTNINGTLYGCKVAVAGMLEQGHGVVYNMEGWGSRGEIREGTSLYGASKAGLTYYTKTLTRELEHTPVRLGTMSPGMVVTDMLYETVRPGREENMRRIMNILGDRVETVAPWLADKALTTDKHGARFAWLGPLKVAARFATARLRPRHIADDMDFTRTPSHQS
jgi:NAD(P)-dependent dehydrogenase (short-subunit alcohol dehydrogenase family)